MKNKKEESERIIPAMEVVGKPPGVTICMADENLKDHASVKKAARICEAAHVFTSVYNGEQLMNFLLKKEAYFSSDKQPDLIIMDIHLRLLDGFEALEQIKADKELRKIPVYILTKDKNDVDVKRAMELGAHDFFKKPLSYEELFMIVEGICKLNFKDGKVITHKKAK